MPPTIAVPLVGRSRPHSMRMVVDFARAIGAQKTEDLARLHVERQTIHGRERAEAARQARGLDGRHVICPARDRGGPSASRMLGERARAIELACKAAQAGHRALPVLVTPTLNRSATTRRASVALRTPSSRPHQRCARGVEIELPLADLECDERIGPPRAARGR